MSEETGAISLGAGGHLVRGLKEEALQQRLLGALEPLAAGDKRVPFTLNIPRLRRKKK